MKHLVLIPSNQDRNIYADREHTEYQVMHQIAEAARAFAARVEGLNVLLAEGSPESRDAWSLQGLYQQLSNSVNWLRGRGARPEETALVSLHSDSSGTIGRHVFGIYGGPRIGASYELAYCVSWVVESLLQTGRHQMLDYSGYAFYRLAGGYPSCLVECGSHQEPEDLEFLLHKQEALAQQIVVGALGYLRLPNTLPVPAEEEDTAYFSARGVPCNPDSAIFKWWRAQRAGGANPGPALTPEKDGAPYREVGSIVQFFENTVVVCKPSESWACYRAQVCLDPKRWFLVG